MSVPAAWSSSMNPIGTAHDRFLQYEHMNGAANGSLRRFAGPVPTREWVSSFTVHSSGRACLRHRCDWSRSSGAARVVRIKCISKPIWPALSFLRWNVSVSQQPLKSMLKRWPSACSMRSSTAPVSLWGARRLARGLAHSTPYASVMELPNHAFNRTRRYGPSTWRPSVAAGRLTWSC